MKIIQFYSANKLDKDLINSFDDSLNMVDEATCDLDIYDPIFLKDKRNIFYYNDSEVAFQCRATSINYLIEMI